MQILKSCTFFVNFWIIVSLMTLDWLGFTNKNVIKMQHGYSGYLLHVFCPLPVEDLNH